MANVSGMVGSALGTGIEMAGSYFGQQAAQKGYAQDRNTQIMNLLAQQQAKQEALGYMAPYLQLGTQGAQGLGKFDLMQGVGPAVSYDTEYTDKLKDYESSPAFQAQNQLAQKDLETQRTARGLSYGAPGAAANASAELSQRLRAMDYDKYRGDLAQRYQALQGEYGLRRDINKDKYQQLMDMTNFGMKAAGTNVDTTRGYSGLTSNIMTGIGKSFNEAGQSRAQFQEGMGAKAGQGLKDMMSAGAGGGWFGK